MRALGFEPVLYVYYDEYEDGEEAVEQIQGAIVDKLIDFDDVFDEVSIPAIVESKGGIRVHQDGAKMYNSSKGPEAVELVTPLTTYNRQQGAFASYGNEARITWAYGDVCMIVRIGRAGDRLRYPRVAQAKREEEWV